MAEGRKIAIWIGVGCLVVLLSAACCGGAAYYFIDQMFAGPRRMANGFFDDLRQGELEDARSRMDRAYQDTHTLDDFEQAVIQVPALRQHEAVRWSGIQVDDPNATLSGRLETESGDLPMQVVLERATNGYWYIERVTVQGAVMP
jgi:hypothetical protein